MYRVVLRFPEFSLIPRAFAYLDCDVPHNACSPPKGSCHNRQAVRSDGCMVPYHRALPADLTEMKGESGSQRKHVIAQTVWIAISVEILECSCVREFQHSTNPFEIRYCVSMP